MNNYHYIIAGLPDLLPDFTSGQFSYRELADSIKEQLSVKDRRTVDWLEFGADTSHLSRHLYRAAARQKNTFIRSWYELDRRIRNSQTRYLAGKEGIDPEKYSVGETESAGEDYPALLQIFQHPDLFEREHMLDRYRWDRIHPGLPGQGNDCGPLELARPRERRGALPPLRGRGQGHIQRH